jgi:lipopolysaccharide transport system permease protein
VFTSFWRHRHLILRLTRREVQAKYRGSLLGLLWALLSPLLLLAVFTFIFSTVFEMRWDVEIRSRSDFALLLFSGLICFWLFSECVSRAPELVFENVSYVKRVVFPLEVLPWVALLSGVFHAALSSLVLLAAYVVWLGTPPWTAALVPILFLPLLLVIMGLSWFLASLGVFLRDTKQIVPVVVTMLMFLSPIFYPLSAIPESFQGFVQLNPLAYIIEEIRAALFYGRLPAWLPFGLAAASGWLVAWLGLVWFQITRKGFADVV